jgi:hypothetical protein
MDEDTSYPPRMYWRYIFRHRPKTRFFSPYRLIPPLLTAVLQFLWLRRNRPVSELEIIAGTICVVYSGLFLLESLWKIIFIAPAKIYAEQIDLIAELNAKVSFLEGELRQPPVPSQEQRRRELVSTEVRKLEEPGRKILRYIHDQGRVDALALRTGSQFNPLVLNAVISRALAGGLILYQNHVITIKPELKPALEFVLSSEYEEG